MAEHRVKFYCSRCGRFEIVRSGIAVQYGICFLCREIDAGRGFNRRRLMIDRLDILGEIKRHGYDNIMWLEDYEKMMDDGKDCYRLT